MDAGDVPGRDRSRPMARLWFAMLDAVDTVSRWSIIAAMAVMTATVVAQVFFRYVLNDSIDAADEVSRLAFVWSILLAIPHGLKTGAHVGIDLLVGRLGRGARSAIFRMTSAAGIVLLLVVAWQALGMAQRVWDQPMPTLPLSNGVFYVGLVISMGHAVLHLVPFVTGWAEEPSVLEEPT
ncbi:MAG: TRAP transporter small permease [Alkalilacustris sp.]